MLRISVKNDAGKKDVLVEVEGRLAGPWVDELERSWEAERGSAGSELITVRLSNVTFIDDAGKNLLRKIFHAGARLEGNGCMVRAIIAGITGSFLAGHDCRGENKASITVESRGGQGEEQ